MPTSRRIDAIVVEKEVNGFKIVSIIPKNITDSENNFEKFVRDLNNTIREGDRSELHKYEISQP